MQPSTAIQIAAAIVATGASVLISGPLSAGDLGSQLDPNADFSAYQSFRWELAEKPRGPRVSTGADLDLLIRGIVTGDLEKAGLVHLSEGEDGDPDLIVTYDAAATPEMDLELVRYNISSNVAWVVDGGTTNLATGSPTRTFFEGTLVVTLRDAASDKAVWSAWTSKRVKNNRNLSKKVENLTGKLMAKLPSFEED